MKILFEKRFLKDIESVNEKNIKAHLEIVISEIEKVSNSSSGSAQPSFSNETLVPTPDDDLPY